jgi:hypothetical protein
MFYLSDRFTHSLLISFMRKKIHFRMHIKDITKEMEFSIARMTSYTDKMTKVIRSEWLSECVTTTFPIPEFIFSSK